MSRAFGDFGRRDAIPTAYTPAQARRVPGRLAENEGSDMGCITIIFGAIMPRLALLAGWSNDPTYWNALFGSQLWLGLGFVFLPWTTLIYGFAAPNGLNLLNIVFIAMAVLLDLGTWGLGFFGGRKEYSNYRGS